MIHLNDKYTEPMNALRIKSKGSIRIGANMSEDVNDSMRNMCCCLKVTQSNFIEFAVIEMLKKINRDITKNSISLIEQHKELFTSKFAKYETRGE